MALTPADLAALSAFPHDRLPNLAVALQALPEHKRETVLAGLTPVKSDTVRRLIAAGDNGYTSQRSAFPMFGERAVLAAAREEGLR